MCLIYFSFLHNALKKINLYQSFMDEATSSSREETPSPDLTTESIQAMTTLSNDGEELHS